MNIYLRVEWIMQRWKNEHITVRRAIHAYTMIVYPLELMDLQILFKKQA